MFTRITVPEGQVREELTEINKVGTQALEFVYNTGRIDTVNSIIWSSRQNTIYDAQPTAGYINFFQGGGVSGPGIYGTQVSIIKPLTYQAVVYTDIVALTIELLANFNLL